MRRNNAQQAIFITGKIGGLAPKRGVMEIGSMFQIFEPLFNQKRPFRIFPNFWFGRGTWIPINVHLIRKIYFVKNSIEFPQNFFGGHEPQATSEILTRLGRFVGAVDPRPRWAPMLCQVHPFPRNLGSKKNLWRHLSAKPEVARSYDLAWWWGLTSCQNLEIFRQTVSELLNIKLSAKYRGGHIVKNTWSSKLLNVARLTTSKLLLRHVGLGIAFVSSIRRQLQEKRPQSRS